jgi:hypothetical protein
MTTLVSVQQSVNQLSSDRVRLLIDGQGLVSAVSDDLDPFVAPTQAHIVGQIGQDAIGLRGRVTLPDGLTLLGGFSYGRLDYRDMVASSEMTSTLALRYAPPGASRPFVEIGVLAGGSDDLTERRTYANGRGVAVGEGGGGYRNDAYWGRLGWIWDLRPSIQVGAYAEFGQAHQSIGGYLEPLSNIDPFEAAVGAGGDRAGIARLGLRYDQFLGGGWELFGGLAVAHAVDEHQTLPIAVDGFGPLTPTPVTAQSWVEYRARLGHSLSPTSSLSLYVSGLSGGSLLGTNLGVGVDFRVVF